jgi:protein-tyrosine phosphatase
MRDRWNRFWAIAPLVLLLVAVGCAKRPLPPGAGPPREIDLDGTRNTRDIGGYTTSEGRRVRWGLLYRSDQLDDLSDEDLRTLRKRGLRRVYDFRTQVEKEDAPDRLDPGVQYVALPISYPSMDPDHLRRLILRGGGGEGYFEDLLNRANRSFVLDNATQIAAFLESLTEPGALPALFHCTYGKDRTGFVAALTLEILGVSQQKAVQDYLLSNDYLAAEIDRMSWLIWFGSFFRV